MILNDWTKAGEMDRLRKTTLLTLLYLLFVIYGVSAQEFIQDHRFGKLTIYSPERFPNKEAKSLVLFISGDGGWEYGVVNMARAIAKQGALVVGIDAKSYRSYLGHQTKGCLYPAADFEQLSLFLQRKYNFSIYQKPLLIGYSYGATFVYALLAQAPAGTFSGGIALGFCPDLELSLPLCKGNGLSYKVLKPGKSYYLNKVPQLPNPFIVLNGLKDETCNYQATAEFLKGIGNTKLISLPKVGHGFSIADNWLPDYIASYQDILKKQQELHQSALALTGQLKTQLPVRIVKAGDNSWKHLLFLISGDGGWTSFDQGLAESFASKNINVIGLDAQKYFWNKKTPEETAKQIDNVLVHYLQQYPDLRVTLMGYSFGACVVPFVAKRLSPITFKSISNLVLLAPDRYGDFEIHVADMLNLSQTKSSYNVVDEVKNVKKLFKLCIFGSDDDPGLSQAFSHQ
ncbi:AcvB/VirJ family lysyl-phosphatidylglycerol hydrolase [Sphingobacterium yanglingense]|uniref:Type IV secretory pathway VirJ component n=1 Tax=Sphingobacterium yanglingense TaxID=1437280 RepID=A0A4R6WPV2_9SPHI|nr:AcvB/VirJ family lysyl-phosphatidylglycerol hydrolase [Sphingobacterium yanglingense]TDQ80191.1 type IV secretory pathway VirJ component [Sphingobacterium yanglingense]